MNIIIEKPKLTSYQKDFLYNKSRFTITEASTKIGKTFAHIWGIYERAHEPWNKENYNHWWVAPVYSQAKIAFNRLKARIARTGIYKINESDLMITCPNGAIIHFKSADKPDNLYGEDVYTVIFDEAPRAKVEAFYALRSTITATGGIMKLIGNFGGIANWMHQLKEKTKNDPEYAYFKITAWDAVKEGILTRKEILQAQKDLPSKIFKQLYLAEEQETDDQLITFDSMRSLFTNEHAEKGERYITADIALHGSDKFAYAVWDGWRIIEFSEVAKMEAPEAEKLLKDLAVRFKVKRSNITYDADGLGAFLRGYLADAKPFNNGSTPFKQAGKNLNYKNLKSQCGYEFAEKVNAGEIMIDCEVDKSELFKELECLQSYELDKDGKLQLLPKIKIKEMIGHSPDKLDCLIMRMIFELKPGLQIFKPKPVSGLNWGG
ncbi:terminase family protein [Christiangramia sp.]|uniref:terminase large subunit domain-containing protein n=1 Tax=Christiangramia sp. TaxID=1931228 RepID=UPI00260DD977|nr:terminase family protein [Christiangramia sp.]